ncbi:MAG TPA: type IX secretion system outer membrane channel protein PorV [Candidatus Avibacteroides faecavium]|nr:type IX secretion system outer membrane channel protein PorV [Candidatus Avibacteroides faecavium]
MRNKTTKTVLLLAAAICTTLAANAKDDPKDIFNPVSHGVTSLAIAPDSRGGGMGDIGAATDPDVNSQYWNPAKYPFTISRAGLAVSYTPWLRKLVNDIDLAYVAGYYRIGDWQAISASLRYFSLGEVPITGSMGEQLSSISPYEMAVDVAYSRMLSQRFSAAVALRFIYSDLAYNRDEGMRPGKAFGADIALFYSDYIMIGQRECMINWGLNLSNIGSKISYDGGNSSEFLPTNFRTGVSLMIPIDNYNIFSISADINKLMVPTRPMQQEGESEVDYQNRLDEEYRDLSPIKGIFTSWGDAPGGFKEELREFTWGLGLEYSYNNQFKVRGGYHWEDASKGNRKYFSVGAGFSMSVFSLDAAYLISTAQSNPLDQTLRFSLAFDMDGLKDLIGRRRR